MRTGIAILCLALFPLCVTPAAGNAQDDTIAIYYDNAGSLERYGNTTQGLPFDLVVGATAAQSSCASEFVMTEITIGRVGLFKLNTTKINNTPLDLGDNSVGEYIISYAGCVGSGFAEIVRIQYLDTAGALGSNVVLSLRGLQPGDSFPSSFGGEMGYSTASDEKRILTPAGDRFTTATGAEIPEGGMVLNPTLPIGPGVELVRTWEESEGGNGHTYYLYNPPTAVTWTEARALADGFVYEDKVGHLAALATEGEAEWAAAAYDSIDAGYWIGGYQDFDAAPTNGWKWITSEEWQQENWAPGYPSGPAWEGYDFAFADNAQSGQWLDSVNERPGVHFILIEFPKIANFVQAQTTVPDLSRSVSWIRPDVAGPYQPYVTRRGVPNQLFDVVLPETLVANTPSILSDSGDGISTLWYDHGDQGVLDAFVMNVGEAPAHYHRAGSDYYPMPISLEQIDASDARAGFAFDANADRKLDLFLVRAAGKADLILEMEYLFADVTPPSVGVPATSTAVAPGDFDNDGDLDAYVVRWNSPNALLRNDGDGSWTDVTSSLLADSGDGTSAAWGDFDKDGWMDLALTNESGPNLLFRSTGDGGFEDVTPEAMRTDTSNGNASWIDYDNDGNLDLFYTRGPGSDRLWQNVFGTLQPIYAPGLEASGNHAGAAWADYDNDGDMDVLLAEYGSGTQGRLLINQEGSNENSWLEIDLRGVQSNRQGIGARIRVVANGEAQIRDVLCSAGNRSQNMTTVHFGLGSATSVDTLEIRWPSGLIQAGTDIPVDLLITATEGGSLTSSPDAPTLQRSAWLGNAIPNPFNPITTIHFGLNEPGYTTVTVYDVAGRRVRNLVAQSMDSGNHQRQWDGRDDSGSRVSSGVYLYRMQSGTFTETKRMVLLK